MRVLTRPAASSRAATADIDARSAHGHPPADALRDDEEQSEAERERDGRERDVGRPSGEEAARGVLACRSRDEVSRLCDQRPDEIGVLRCGTQPHDMERDARATVGQRHVPEPIEVARAVVEVADEDDRRPLEPPVADLVERALESRGDRASRR